MTIFIWQIIMFGNSNVTDNEFSHRASYMIDYKFTRTYLACCPGGGIWVRN